MMSGEDERIQGDVSERLTAELPDDAAQIQVNVTHGEVTLAGTVDTSEARRRAENVAESIAGVVSVMNDLRVRQPVGQVLPDERTPAHRTPLKQWRPENLVAAGATEPDADQRAQRHEDQEAVDHHQERWRDPRRVGLRRRRSGETWRQIAAPKHCGRGLRHQQSARAPAGRDGRDRLTERRSIAAPPKQCASAGLVAAGATEPDADERAQRHEDQEAVDHDQERRRDPRRVGLEAGAVRGTPAARSPRQSRRR